MRTVNPCVLEILCIYPNPIKCPLKRDLGTVHKLLPGGVGDFGFSSAKKRTPPLEICEKMHAPLGDLRKNGRPPNTYNAVITQLELFSIGLYPRTLFKTFR